MKKVWNKIFGPKKPKPKQTASESLSGILLAILVALAFRTFCYEPFVIPSGSMINTLLIGDFLFVNKFNYGIGKYAFPFGLAPIEKRWFETEPQRGDVVVFRTDFQPGKDFVKRLVGMPGDKVKVTEGRLYINGQLLKLEKIGPIDYDDHVVERFQATLYEETLPNGVKHPVVIDDPMGSATFDNTSTYTVPEGHYFMMGDHRQRSDDSRNLNSMGFIPARNIVGRASYIFFSIDKSDNGYLKIWEWPKRIRWDRLFTHIH